MKSTRIAVSRQTSEQFPSQITEYFKITHFTSRIATQAIYRAVIRRVTIIAYTQAIHL